jgi:uncharacterized membrane protein YphA (DoxX/SURF4 family)
MPLYLNSLEDMLQGVFTTGCFSEACLKLKAGVNNMSNYFSKLTRPDIDDFIFRSLFCLIFVGLGAEHLFSDQLIQKLMPSWVTYPRAASIVCGVWLITFGSLILLGWHLKIAAIALGSFLIIVTAAVHLPGVISAPIEIPEQSLWMWDILQRTNLVKNICLLGVCFHLLNHQPGRLSVEKWLKKVFH